MYLQVNTRVLVGEFMQDGRQDELCLGMGGSDAQTAAVGIGVFSGGLLDALDVVQQSVDMLKNCITGRGNTGKFLSRTFEDLDIQFFFQQLDLVTDSGLRRVQLFSRG